MSFFRPNEQIAETQQSTDDTSPLALPGADDPSVFNASPMKVGVAQQRLLALVSTIMVPVNQQQTHMHNLALAEAARLEQVVDASMSGRNAARAPFIFLYTSKMAHRLDPVLALQDLLDDDDGANETTACLPHPPVHGEEPKPAS